MSTSAKIRELLDKGYKPSEIVRMGYAKATVYTVYKKWIEEKLHALRSLIDLAELLRELIVCAPLRTNSYLCLYGDKKMRIDVVEVKENIYVIELSEAS